MITISFDKIMERMTNISNPRFGTDGIRGTVGRDLTPQLMMHLGFLIGKTLNRNGPIIIGNDSRRSNSMLVSALTSGLNGAGKEVWQIGLCPTPAVSILVRNFQAAGGIMVSASHNPPEDNGIKIFDFNGIKINSKQQDLIESRLKNNYLEELSLQKNDYGNCFYRSEIIKHYSKEVMKSLPHKQLTGLNIILDLCWGSATICGAKMFKELGANLTVINGEANGDLINVNCGSTNLNQLRETVLKQQADMGFAFDGDADRMLAIDSQGRLIDGDHILYLWGQELAESNALPNKRLVGTVMSNLGLEKAWQAKGGVLERAPVGDQNVHAAMISKGATLGGEQSGHILAASNGFCGDGLFTALQIATICHSKKISLAKWRDQSFKPFPQKMINLTLPKGYDFLNTKDSEEINEVIYKAKKAMGKNGRILIRPSGTEPLIRIMVEAEEEQIANTWCTEIAQIFSQSLSA